MLITHKKQSESTDLLISNISCSDHNKIRYNDDYGVTVKPGMYKVALIRSDNLLVSIEVERSRSMSSEVVVDKTNY